MTAPTPREVAETLRGAAREIQRKGHARSIEEIINEDKVCAAIAIDEAADTEATRAASLAAFRMFIGGEVIPHWNDRHTQPEVEKALLQAADRIEVGE